MLDVLARGNVAKMESVLPAEASAPIEYYLPLGEHRVHLNPYVGQKVELKFVGQINCKHCGRKTNKSFSQGFCYPCFSKLAQCDLCIMSPEKCHYDEGTCREPEWADEFCMSDHIVYLSNSSAPKVGITRISQIPTRWVDQGAIQALPIFRVKTRQHSGFVEDALREHIADKTNWRALLKGDAEKVDLPALADRLIDQSQEDLEFFVESYGLQALHHISGVEVQELVYPVLEYPSKVVTHNLDKVPLVEGTLLGIKGQYWILDTGVINIRKYSAYDLEFSAA